MLPARKAKGLLMIYLCCSQTHMCSSRRWKVLKLKGAFSFGARFSKAGSCGHGSQKQAEKAARVQQPGYQM